MITSRPTCVRYSVGIVTVLLILGLYLLHPFRERSVLLGTSPFTTAKDPSNVESSPTPQWLLGIFSSPTKEGTAQREAIRATWVTRYRNPAYECRFILGNYSAHPDASGIEAENATHGDIWAIEGYMNENSVTANKIKNLEFFAYMAKYGGKRFPRYQFVSKVDEDNWLNIPQYFKTFLAPRLPGGSKYIGQKDHMIYIGRPMNWGLEYIYASGIMYTLNWPLVEYTSRKYLANPTIDRTEDEAVGQYLYEDLTPVEFVTQEVEQAWDIGLEYIVNNKTIQIHSIKDSQTLREVSELFDDTGVWNGKALSGVTSYDRNYKGTVARLDPPKDWEQKFLDVAAPTDDPWQSMDFQLIQWNCYYEDRERMGNFYPMNLTGNNVSTDIVPIQWGGCREHKDCLQKPDAMNAWLEKEAKGFSPT